MRRVLFGVVLLAVMVLSFAQIGMAVTQDEAKALVEKVVAFWKVNGKDKTIAEVNDPKGQFVKGDLYAFINGFDGTILANGGNIKLVGQNHLELKDATGKLFNKEMVEAAKTKGTGWTDYSWVNPVTKKVQPKSTYYQRIEGANFYVGSGIWK